MGDPVALVNAYDRFVAGGDHPDVVALSLSNLRGLSSEDLNAGGQVTVNLATGAVNSRVQLLPADGTFDLWLIDNIPGAGHTTFAQQGDGLMKVGSYVSGAGGQALSMSLGSSAFISFFPDRAFVVRAGGSPVDGFVLTGPSTLLTRLRHRQVRFVNHASAPHGFNPAAAASRAANFARVIADGRRLFVHETFGGNGRTCATCHVESNNFTVDPALIATLPPSDPLFVAETNPALATLENSELLRRFGLILVNADGFDPRDGGFGQVPTVFGSFGNTDDLPPPFGHFEIEEFNSPPVVESADTGPFFHNHTAADLEGAVAFYGSDAFKNSLVPTLIPIEISADPNDPDVQAIAAFLRVLSALENIRSSIEVADRGKGMTSAVDMRDLARLSLAETDDALQVLSEGAFASRSDAAIRSARFRLRAARLALGVARHLHARWAIDDLLGAAIQQLRRARTALAMPATLPASFVN